MVYFWFTFGIFKVAFWVVMVDVKRTMELFYAILYKKTVFP